MSDSATATYYVHSTVLGGKTIAELDQFGMKTKGYVYAGGARVATQTVAGGSNSVQIESTNPVTGAAIVTDANGSSAARQEPDPLGRELSQAPDPTVVVDPIASSKFNDPMPVEYAPQWTGEMERGMRRYEAFVAERTAAYIYNATKREFLKALLDLGRTGDNKFYDKMQKILTKNPNFMISINGEWTAGRDAANALDGAMAKLPGDPLGLTSINAAPLIQHSSGNGSGGLGGGRVPTRESLNNDAFQDAAHILLTDSSCATFFGIADDRSRSRVLSVFRAIRKSATIDQNFTFATARTEGSGRTAHVVVGRAFFDDPAIRLNTISSPTDPTQFRAHTVLHEFAHVLGLIPNDGGDLDQGITNNKTITEHCGKGLGKL